jgi:eukaryotic-like serine/threonine-protein kinase
VSLTPGTRLGPYEVLDKLGEGGMGVVYRARDTKLNRDVALKVLSDLVVSDPDRLARFRREAQVLASLNHPNIGQIYGVEDNALVLELVEGPTLEEVIAAAPHGVPLPEAMRIASQVALALETAHERGIIHRDLKPSNVKVRDDATVKVLDFGLAKALAPEGGSGVTDISDSPTLTARGTKLGMILGTAAYMSPEQARGKAVDRRADVWAFGVVLYEMLTGRRAFDGAEVSDVLASVLKDTVPLGTLPVETPAAIRRLLRRCLEKDRASRLDSMTTARLEIEDAMSNRLDDLAAPPGSVARVVARPVPNLALAVVAIAALAIGLAAGYLFFRSPPAQAPVGRTVRFSVPLPSSVLPASVAITGDSTIIYLADRLYARGLDDPAFRPLTGTEGARNLFVSPDGRWIGFYQGEYIKKVAVGGGDPLTITEASSDSPGGGWGPNNTVVFTRGWNLPLLSVPADGGGKPVPLTTIDTASGELGHWWPVLLPDGKTVLFTVWMAAAGINDSKIAVLDVATGKHRVIMPGAAAKYMAPGRLLYFFAGAYQVVDFDPVALRPTGEPRKVIPDATPLDPSGSPEKPVAVSADGTLAYLTGSLYPESQLAWLTPKGDVTPIALAPERYARVELSPDGRQVVSSRVDSGVERLWLADLVRLTEEKLDSPGMSFGPHWSPSGDFIVFTSMRTGNFDVATIRPEERAKVIIGDPFDQTPSALTKDGKVVLIKEYYPDGTVGLALASLDRPQDRKRLPIDAAIFRAATLSPDDQWVAIQTRSSGRSEIHVQSLQQPGRVVRVTSRGGAMAVWAKKSPTIYYARDDELVAATYSTTGGRFSVVREDTLARPGLFQLAGVAPDGRFLIAKLRPGQETTLQVVVNWMGR